jgi:hypothetical protein
LLYNKHHTPAAGRILLLVQNWSMVRPFPLVFR